MKNNFFLKEPQFISNIETLVIYFVLYCNIYLFIFQFSGQMYVVVSCKKCVSVLGPK